MNETKYDVLIGGGSEGMGEAVEAAVAGARTLLVEKHPIICGILD